MTLCIITIHYNAHLSSAVPGDGAFHIITLCRLYIFWRSMSIDKYPVVTCPKLIAEIQQKLLILNMM